LRFGLSFLGEVFLGDVFLGDIVLVEIFLGEVFFTGMLGMFGVISITADGARC